MDQRGNGTLAGLGTLIRIRVDDLAFIPGEAIIWPVNATLGAPTSLLRRLEQAGGQTLAAQLTIQDPLPVGSAIVTGAGALAVELLVSAVVSSDDEAVSRASVRRALTSALQRASDWRIRSVLCAPFGLGAGNLDIEEVAPIMVEVVRQHAERARYPEEITIVVENAMEEGVFNAALPERDA